MLNTEQIRREWAPLRCTTSGCYAVPIGEHGAAVLVHPENAAVWRWFDALVRRHRYRVRREDTGSYNCRRVTGGKGWSTHAYVGVAVDVNWRTNPYHPTRLVTDMPPALIAEVRALRTRSGHRVLAWGGDWSRPKDAMHFQLACTRAQLRTGLAVADQAPPAPPAPPATPSPLLIGEEMPRCVFDTTKRRAYVLEFGSGFPGRRIYFKGWYTAEELCRTFGQPFESKAHFRKAYGFNTAQLDAVSKALESGPEVQRIEAMYGGK